jgi:FMN phosphatase YigB (HAD superfamily)
MDRMETTFTILLDWGDTLMRVLPNDGPMADWPQVAAVPGARHALAAMHGRARLVVVSNAQAPGPSEVIVVGDDYDRDIAPAARIGARTVWLADSDQSRGDTTVITNMRDLPAAIGCLR